VHPGVWFEAKIQTSNGFILPCDEITRWHKLPGRLSASGCSDLRVVIHDDHIRVDDVANMEAWATVPLPQEIQDDIWIKPAEIEKGKPNE
jgi:hypothetical protein